MSTDHQLEIPPFYCPIRVSVHPAAEVIDRRATAWMAARDFCGNPRTLTTLANADIGGFIGRLFPSGNEAALEAITKLHLWGFAFDDEIEVLAAKELTKAMDQHGQLMRMLDIPRQWTPGENIYADVFREISEDLRDLAAPAVWRRWVDRNRAFTLGVVWGCAYRQAGTIPTPDRVTTIRMQDAGGGSYATGLVELAGGFEVPVHDLMRAEVRALTDMTEVILAWDNDIYSYFSETEKHVEDINLVTSLVEHGSLNAQQALIEAMRMRNRVMWCYLRYRREFPAPPGDPLHRYLTGLDDLIRGHLDWALRRTRRYDIDGLDTTWLTVSEADVSHGGDYDLTEPVELPTIRWWWDLLATYQ
jgi:hypothetical protein